MSWGFYTLLTLFFINAALLCAIILSQESKSMGLGASFGGEGGNSLFGTSTASILKKITAYMAGIFLVLSLLLSFWSQESVRRAQAPSLVYEVSE
ncbi:MAG: preprotein translocase subunit SecG [Chlamydiota bacterium]|nr:preprotein translocase subunit SecG [Chlamydiota bacterium]